MPFQQIDVIGVNLSQYIHFLTKFTNLICESQILWLAK